MEVALNSINSALEIIRNAKVKINERGLEGASSNSYVGGYSESPIGNPTPPPPYMPEFLQNYGQSVEARAITDRESDFMDRLNSNNYGRLNATNYQEILDARAQYNLGQGDPMELFSKYMPNRAALGGDDLIAYDAQFHRILEHMDNTTVLDDGLTADPSLKFILAASLAEVLAQSPRLVDVVLKDINQGWHISNDNSHFDDPDHVGLYNSSTRKKWPWSSRRYYGKITLSLGSTLESFVNADDSWDILAHEVAHSIDRYGGRSTDGIPGIMDSNDAATFIEVRNEFFASNAATGSVNGLREYAYENEKEFWATASARFLGGQDSAQDIYDNSPELYGVLSRFYEMEYPIERPEIPIHEFDIDELVS